MAQLRDPVRTDSTMMVACMPFLHENVEHTLTGAVPRTRSTLHQSVLLGELRRTHTSSSPVAFRTAYRWMFEGVPRERHVPTTMAM